MNSIKKLGALAVTGLLASAVLTSCSKDDDIDCIGCPIGGGNSAITAITQDTTWTSNNVIELSGKVVVNSGVTLTIDAGALIKGGAGTGSEASALIIARGGKIMANGTATDPIIMTSIQDDIELGQLTGTNLDGADNGKWGGLIVLGNAPISAAEGDDVANIEGIPANEEFGKYGGTNAADNSGTIKYVSIRHCGVALSEGNEINGLTLGGVGSGTTIDYVEVAATFDDGIELFGGTVNVTNAIVVFQGDDAFDIDQNYGGSLSNVMAILGAGADNALEIDGPEGTLADGSFTITNGTFKSNTGDKRAATFKSKAQGSISGSSFEGFDNYVRVRASYTNDCVDTKTDAFSNYMTASTLNITGNSFANGMLDVITVYTESTNDAGDADCAVSSTEQDDADTKFAADGNTTGSSVTGGADASRFVGWTWADANSEL